MDHVRRPRNTGELARLDGVGRAGHGEHEYVEISIRVREDVIVEIAQCAAGCEASLAAASVVTELAQGKHLDEAAEITQDTVVSALGGLPADKRHAAGLAAEALAEAIWDYVVKNIERTEGRRAKSEGRREKTEGRREKGEERKSKTRGR